MKKYSQLMLLLTIIMALTVLMSPASSLQAAQATPTPNEVDAVAKELWCPLCNGVRLDNCELQACVQMRELIAQKLQEGQNTEEIKAYFVAQYGDVVLGVPTHQGFNALAWILPILAALVALGWLAYLVYTWSRRRPAAAKAPTSGPASTPNGKSDYIKRVDEELRKYE